MNRHVYEIHYTNEEITLKPPKKVICNTNNNIVFTNNKDEVTCIKCLKKLRKQTQ